MNITVQSPPQEMNHPADAPVNITAKVNELTAGKTLQVVITARYTDASENDREYVSLIHLT